MTTLPPQEPPPPPPQQPYPIGRIYPANPPRDPIVALLLNVFFFCGGYFFIGQMQKGLVGLVIFLGYLGVAFLGGLITGGCATCIVIPLGLALNAVTAVDGYLQAQQL